MAEKTDKRLTILQPADIDVSRDFMGTVWRNSERETVARNIVMLCSRMGCWVTFTWEEYRTLSDHKVIDSERKFINHLADEGYLDRDGDTFQPNIRFVGVVSEFRKS